MSLLLVPTQRTRQTQRRRRRVTRVLGHPAWSCPVRYAPHEASLESLAWPAMRQTGVVFAPGSTAVRRDVFRGKVWTATPFRVVRDGSDLLALAIWPGEKMLAPTHQKRCCPLGGTRSSAPSRYRTWRQDAGSSLPLPGSSRPSCPSWCPAPPSVSTSSSVRPCTS